MPHEWLPAITSVVALLLNLAVTLLNIRNSRVLEQHKKRLEDSANNIKLLVELKHRLHTVETPEDFDGRDLAWAIKQGASRETMLAALTQYLSAQAEGFHLAEGEFKAASHLFDLDLRQELQQTLKRCSEADASVSASANRTDSPLDASGLQDIDTVIRLRRAFISTLYAHLDAAIDRHRSALG